MKINSKNGGSLLLLFTVAMPFLFFLFSLCKQVWIQHEMMEKLEEASLTTVTISQAEFSWVREGKEVSINGHLFDVHSYKQTGISFSFTGLFDEDEDKIAENVQLIFHQKQSGNHAEKLSISFLFLPFYSPASGFNVQPDWKFISSANRGFANKSLPETVLKITTPPPRTVTSI